MKIAVFGSAYPTPGHPVYEEALLLGRLLGEAGHTVLSGGYIGTMEAVSRGAAQAGAHVIGVTCQEIENWRPVDPNQWIKEEWRFATLHERILALIDGSDAALALPGGSGTLAEICLLWNRLSIEAIPPRPLILIGEGWRQVFDCLFNVQGVHIAEHYRRQLSFAADVKEAVSLLTDGR